VVENRVLMACFIMAAFISMSIFIAPFSLEKNTVGNLDGSAWKIDYAGIWDGMPSFQRAIYYFGDLNCHQKSYRSYFINGNQMPVCSRDTGMLIGLSAGFFISMFSPKGRSIGETAFRMFRGRVKGMGRLAALLVFLILPASADGFLQIYTGYESINPLRTLTGFMLGLGISIIASLLVLTDPRID